jgi:hypothetical protein
VEGKISKICASRKCKKKKKKKKNLLGQQIMRGNSELAGKTLLELLLVPIQRIIRFKILIGVNFHNKEKKKNFAFFFFYEKIFFHPFVFYPYFFYLCRN